uniref:Response regulator containing CheY-like receiver n=1 Tax=Magnetospirillum gryphiswaldense TaxID=55518 RepID=A4TTR2_9PROT|nr:Response regulator containing CheY-like receiver [Magnetospirillum gryphiswaldense MSR-1]
MAHDFLIVDNEADIRALDRGILEDEGYSTREAGNSDAPLEPFRARRPNLNIQEIWLPSLEPGRLGLLAGANNDPPVCRG